MEVFEDETKKLQLLYVFAPNVTFAQQSWNQLKYPNFTYGMQNWDQPKNNTFCLPVTFMFMINNFVENHSERQANNEFLDSIFSKVAPIPVV